MKTLQAFALRVACLENRRNKRNPNGHSPNKYISLFRVVECVMLKGWTPKKKK